VPFCGLKACLNLDFKTCPSLLPPPGFKQVLTGQGTRIFIEFFLIVVEGMNKNKA
jgi:hypothetical protein